MTIQAGKMYRASDIAFDTANNSVYVVEKFNHRISKWIYPTDSFTFSLADGNVVTISGTLPTGTSGYVTALLVIDGPTGTATATPTVSGGITSIAVDTPGSGYTTAPNVTIFAVAGANATATAEIANGIVTRIIVTNQGSGYLTATQVTPIVVIDAPEGKSRATATAATSGGQISAVTLTSNGNGYDVAVPLVSIVSDSGNIGDAALVTTTENIPAWGTNNDGTTGKGGPIVAGAGGGLTDTNLYRPSGIVFDGTRLVVTDTFHDRIRTLATSDGAFIASVGQSGNGDNINDFYHPAGIATDNTILVIADELNHRAVKYAVGDTPSGAAELPGPPTPANKAFNRPHGVIFEDTNNFFMITDSYHGVISRYNTAATAFQAQFGDPGTTGIKLFFPGSGHGILTGDSTTAFADTRNSILKTVTTDTIVNTTNTIPGTGNGELYYPESVSSFTDGTTNYVLAANTLNNRVEIFSNSADALTSESPFNFGKPE